MSSTSRTLKRLGVGSVGVVTILATPYLGAATAFAVPAPATVTIASQAGGFASTRNDGTNTTVKISATVTPPQTGGGAAVAAVRFSYQSGATTTVIGTDNTAPYSIEWTPPAAGAYTELAEGLDTNGTVIGGPGSPATDTQAATVGDLSSAHITSPTDGGTIGRSAAGTIIVSGTRSADLPAVAVSATTIDNTDGSTIGTGSTDTPTIPAGVVGTDSANWATAVTTPACTSTTSCDVVIRAVATGAGTSDEVVESTLYSQTLTGYTVTPASASQPVGSAQTYTVTATDQNGKPVSGAPVIYSADKGTVTFTPVSPGVTDQTGTFKFDAKDSVAETATITVKSGNVPATDFTRTATLTSYTPALTSLAFSATPSKAEYATNGTGANDDEYTTTTPKVDLCVKDQNGNPTLVGVTPANLVITVTRTSSTGGTAATPVTSPVVGPAQDGTSACYVIPHGDSAAVDFGTDTFNAYYENNGTPGFQAGSSDVAAAPLTTKFAVLSIKGDNTQALQGTNVTVAFTVKGADGSVFANRKVILTSGSGTFPSGQPAGTTFIDGGNATAVTDANGVVNVTVTKTTAGSVTVTAADTTDATRNQINTGKSGQAIVSFRAQSIALTLAQKGVPYILLPDGTHDPDAPGMPGAPLINTYTLKDVNNLPLANVPVTVTTDHGFFTPLPTNTGDYTTLTFSPAKADGAQVGNLSSLGASFTGKTDDNGQITLALGIGRDAAFDVNGRINDKLTFAATNGTNVVNNPADFNQVGTDFPFTWSTNQSDVNGGGVDGNPLNGGTVKLLPATAADKLSGDVQADGSNNTNQNTFTNTGSNFRLQATDQFGNLVRVCNIALSVTGGGFINSVGQTALANQCSQYTSNTSSYLVDSETSSKTGESDTVTATWPAPRTLFKATANPGPPATTTWSVVQGTPVNTTDSFTINLYAIDQANLAYTFGNTPAQSTYPVNTAVTTSVTVKDQKGNPVKGLCVQFLRSGPNDAAGNSQNGGSTGTCGVSTNTLGKAGTTYSSGTPGTATVTVIVTDGSGNELSRGVVNTVFVAGIPQTKIPTISISTTAINVGKSAIVTVHGTPGDSIQLYALTRPATSYQVVRTVTLPASGVYSTAITPRGNTRLFARSAAGDSGTVAVSVRPAMSLAGSVSGKTGTFTGTIVPGHGNVTVRLFTVKNGVITLVGTTLTRADGHYTYSRKFAATGAVTFIAQTLSDGQNLSTQSNRVTVTF
jgi:hypothetical protein